jgi:hypothetical protein
MRTSTNLIQGSKAKKAFQLAGKAFWLNDPHQHEEVAIFLEKSADSEW